MNINSKEREYTANPLWQGSVHEFKKRQDLYVLNWKSSYDVIAKYYVYHGFELKAFEERHIRIMHNVRDYSVFYNIALRPTVCEGSYFTHVWKTLAWPHHVTKSLTTPPLIVVHVSSYESGWSCIWV
jgi:hypothetical protein